MKINGFLPNVIYIESHILFISYTISSDFSALHFYNCWKLTWYILTEIFYIFKYCAVKSSLEAFIYIVFGFYFSQFV